VDLRQLLYNSQWVRQFRTIDSIVQSNPKMLDKISNDPIKKNVLLIIDPQIDFHPEVCILLRSLIYVNCLLWSYREVNPVLAGTTQPGPSPYQEPMKTAIASLRWSRSTSTRFTRYTFRWTLTSLPTSPTRCSGPVAKTVCSGLFITAGKKIKVYKLLLKVLMYLTSRGNPAHTIHGDYPRWRGQGQVETAWQPGGNSQLVHVLHWVAGAQGPNEAGHLAAALHHWQQVISIAMMWF